MYNFASWNTEHIGSEKEQIKKYTEDFYNDIQRIQKLIDKHNEINKGKTAENFTEVGNAAQKEHIKQGAVGDNLVAIFTQEIEQIMDTDSITASRLTMQQ